MGGPLTESFSILSVKWEPTESCRKLEPIWHFSNKGSVRSLLEEFFFFNQAFLDISF